jgi:MoxR-like ATPase
VAWRPKVEQKPKWIEREDPVTVFGSVSDARRALEAAGYICTRQIATVVFLAAATDKPLLVEGPAGVGKTELAKAVASSLGRQMIRLQCYEGLDEAKALYEWEYAKQLLYTQIVKDKVRELVGSAASLAEAVERIAAEENAFFSERFMLARPLLKAITAKDPVVLLIDEVDKSDPEFEAFLLELLSDFQVTIPELGTRQAATIPLVVLTSNNFRDMSDALKRRCLHLYIDYPDPDQELAIVRSKVPGLAEDLAHRMVDAMGRIRRLDLKKKPSISETLDWARALIALQLDTLSPEVVEDTLNVICKYREDARQVREQAGKVAGST